MSQSVTVTATIAKIRQRADLETADEANSVVTDAELVTVVNDGYRELYDLIAEAAGHEYFVTSATVTAPTFSLPATFYRALGVDLPNFWGTNLPLTADRFSFRERNRRALWLAQSGYWAPTYRIQNGVIAWEPAAAAPTTSVTLWYVPTPAALAAGGSFDAVNGWDDYVAAYGVVYCMDKQELDPKPALLKLARAEARVRRNAGRIVQDPITVADLRDCSDIYFLNS